MMFTRTPITQRRRAAQDAAVVLGPRRGDARAVRRDRRARGRRCRVEDAARAYEEQAASTAFSRCRRRRSPSSGRRRRSTLSELRLGFLPGCMVMTNRAWDQLDVERARGDHRARRRSSRRGSRISGARRTRELLGTLFERQGLKQTPVSAAFAAEFFELARGARESVRDKLDPGRAHRSRRPAGSPTIAPSTRVRARTGNRAAQTNCAARLTYGA